MKISQKTRATAIRVLDILASNPGTVMWKVVEELRANRHLVTWAIVAVQARIPSAGFDCRQVWCGEAAGILRDGCSAGDIVEVRLTSRDSPQAARQRIRRRSL